MAGEFGPGEVYNRRVTKHIRTLLPDRTRPQDDFTFGGETVLDRENNPGKPAGGVCRIKAYVGKDGQLTVLERSRVRSEDEVLWASRNLVRRTRAVNCAEMEPFHYHVQTKILGRDSTKTNRETVEIAQFTSNPVFGGHEAQAAVLLAERIAIEKESSRRSGKGTCCSLANLPSLSRVIDEGWIDLDWEQVNDLLGPDAETIAASVSVELVRDEERKEAEAKGLEMFTDSDGELADAAGDRTPANAERSHEESGNEREQSPTKLPDDMSEREAKRKLLEMVEQIRRMKSEK